MNVQMGDEKRENWAHWQWKSLGLTRWFGEFGGDTMFDSGILFSSSTNFL